ncbi:Oxidoreductase NAD-binding domain-containing protein 1 [Frankliniella fusca]|uniref:Oxidoreductase NAD-binding domain-containing protein 1 n=1 Tax=Frankliniella fusca TaxID=407009 RepID=A0AAE1L7G8_9NEOP|nr:Oxidoreductase NAD-binding domain-containing protein 1 [Frankliniella fusca]
MSPPLQGKITLTGQHSHQTENFKAFKLLRISEETKELFNDYFNNGYSVANAIHAHEAQLVLKYPEESEYVRCNASLNPLPRTVYYLHNLWLKSTYGLAWSNKSPIDKLKEKLDQYKKEDIDVIIDEKDSRWCVLIVTPIMKRAHCLPEAKEIIFTDSTASCDAENTVVSLLLTATKGGAVPLCVLLHNRQDTAGYKHAYQMLAKHYPNCFGKLSCPEVFMTDDSVQEKDGLAAVWPDALQYLCHFHVGQAEWRWLCEGKNQVDINDRQPLIRLFQQIMYAVDTESYEEAKENFTESCSYGNYFNRVDSFLEREKEWALIFRSETINRGHNTNNFSEASIRVIKDIVLGRTKAYNSCALVDYISHVWEDHMQRRLLHYAYDREAKPRLVYNRLLKKMPPDTKIEKIEDDLYMVQSAKKADLSYEVNSLVGWCSCPSGRSGAFCKHQALVFSRYGVGFPNKPAVTFNDRYRLGLLALGPEKCPKIDFFKDFDEENDAPTKDNSFLEDIQMNAVVQQPEETMDIGEGSEQQGAVDPEKRKKLLNELKEQIDRLHEVVKDEGGDVYDKTLETLIARLKKPSTPGQVMETMIRWKAASLVCSRRRAKIKVMPAAIQRRKEGKSRGAARIRAGRPPNNEPKNIRKPLPRILKKSVAANKPHVKTHSRK